MGVWMATMSGQATIVYPDDTRFSFTAWPENHEDQDRTARLLAAGMEPCKTMEDMNQYADLLKILVPRLRSKHRQMLEAAWTARTDLMAIQGSCAALMCIILGYATGCAATYNKTEDAE